jgi:predicted RND superfamily exporter protein
MSFFETRYLRAQEVASRHAIAVIATIALAFLLASFGILSLHLDLSFRPLFASGADIAEPTEEFETVFGQSSGAWIIAILENNGQATGDFIRRSAVLSEHARDIAGVTEILSITALRIPQWRDETLTFVAPIPEYLLDPDENEELLVQYDELLDGTRFVNWLVSADGNKLLLAGRLDLPLDDLDGRRKVVQEFQSLIQDAADDAMRVHFSGVSVVELAYEKQVFRDQLIATAITSVMLMLLLYLTLGNLRLVLVCLTPVTLAIPATLGLMGWLGLPLTLINTVIPAVILVIGVADAVHMLNAWLEARSGGADRHRATNSMLAATGKACFFTTVTTMGGFAALATAHLQAVGNFGLSVASGIFVAWLANQALLPWMLRKFDVGDGLSGGRVNQLADGAVAGMLQQAVARPVYMLVGGLVFTLACCALIPSLIVEQRFNEELPVDHPITRGQEILEADFGGFLGPEISIRRLDRGSMVTNDEQLKLTQFVAALQNLPDTHHVWSVQDLLPLQVRQGEREQVLQALRTTAASVQWASELINDDNNRLAVIVRIGDIGTGRAAAYRAAVQQIVADVWGEAYQVDVVGQWWLAQHGMRLLLRDMLTSLATAMLIVLPLMWFALRDLRLFVAATIANVLPLLLPLAFMAATGIALRIGTAVVLALALGIVVDNTLHIIIRLRAGLTADGDLRNQLQDAMHGTGRAVVFTTIALIGGFLSMLANDLLAIRDMGLVAAVTIAGAMLADLLILPAIYVLSGGTRSAAKVLAVPGENQKNPDARTVR